MVEHELSAIVQYPLLNHCGEPMGSRYYSAASASASSAARASK